MTGIPFVSWPDNGFGGCWDHAIIDDVIHVSQFGPGRVKIIPWSPDIAHTADAVAIVHVSARFHIDRVDELNDYLNAWSGVVLILTSDEEHTFPVENLAHPNMRIWRQLPRVDHPSWPLISRGFGEGVPYDTTPEHAEARDLAWVFAGQITHQRRDWWMLTMVDRFMSDRHEKAILIATKAFTDGVERDEYLNLLGRSRAVVCPSGAASQSSFRVYEALEAGAIPIADDVRPDGGGSGYWDAVFAERPPFPVVTTPDMSVIDETQAMGKWGRLRVWAWWAREQRQMRHDLLDDLLEVGGPVVDVAGVYERLTFLVTASPIENQRDVLLETIDSLPAGCDVVVAFDGVRPEQEPVTERYLDDVEDLLATFLDEYRFVTPFLPDGWMHQARLTQEALRHVYTPYVCFVEHDTPVEGDIPWEALCDAVSGSDLDVVRLYHEHQIPAEHEYLHGDTSTISGLQIRRTRQWSQRPHIATTDWYRDMLGQHFDDDDRTMIEDRIYGSCESGGVGRVGIYHEVDSQGSIKRSGHLDGRGDDPKYRMLWGGEWRD